MDISNLIKLDSIFPSFKATSKKQFLQELGAIAKAKINKPSHEITSVLMERERLGSTGVGHGVAIPRCDGAGSNRAVTHSGRCAIPFRRRLYAVRGLSRRLAPGRGRQRRTIVANLQESTP